MTKKRWYLAVGILTVVTVASWLIKDYRPFSAISPVSYYRIELGTPAERVEEIIGLPPGYHGPPKQFFGLTVWPFEMMAESGVFHEPKKDGRIQGAWWEDSHYHIHIDVDENGLVIGKRLFKHH